MPNIYWSPENGSDANTGLTVDQPIQTVTKIKAIGLADGDEIRVLRDGPSTLEAGTGNCTFTLGSRVVNCPADFTFGNFQVGDLIMAPDDRFYFISDVQPGGADELELAEPYRGGTATPPAVRRVSITRPGVDKTAADYLFDISLHFTTTPITISGGWYDSGGAVAAQETVNTVVVPTYLAWNEVGVGNPLFNNGDLGFEGFIIQDLAFTAVGNTWLTNDSGNEGDIPSGDNSSANYMRNFTVERTHFQGYDQILEGSMDQSVTYRNSHCYAMKDVYHTIAALSSGDLFRDLTFQNLRLAECGLWRVTGTVVGISERLIIDGVDIYDYSPLVVVPNSVLVNIVLGQAVYGINIQNSTSEGTDAGGIFLVPRAWGTDRQGVVPNLLSDITLNIPDGDCLLGSVLGTAGDIKIKNLTVQVDNGGIFNPLALFFNSEREFPVTLSNVQITGTITGVQWAGVGHYLFLNSDPGGAGIVHLPLDTSIFGDSLLNADFPGMMRVVDDVGGSPGNEMGYVGDLVGQKELTIDAGVITPDLGVQVSGRSLQWAAPGDTTELKAGSFPFFIPILAGQRTVAAKLRKTASFTAPSEAIWPRLRIISRSWNGGDPILNENIVSISPGTNDVFEDVSQILTIDHDQTIIVYWEGLDESDAGSMWIDDLIIQ